MMLEASLLRFGGRGAFLNVLYVRCFAYTVSECGTKHLLLFTHHYPETYKPKFHCRRQSGMNFGYVTVNGVNSNVNFGDSVIFLVCS